MTGYWVDLPNPNSTEPGDAYVNVGTFESRREARKWLKEVHGMPAKIADFFITEGADL